MTEKIKALCRRYREQLLYLIFGGVTTLVDWLVSFWLYRVWDTTIDAHVFVIHGANLVAWVAAVLFAFYTNKKWVFTDADKNVSTAKQLAVFASGRVVTFLLDYVVTFFGALLLSKILPFANNVLLFEREWNLNEIGAKLVAAIIVIIGNYFFSKLIVFKKKKNNA